MTSTVAEKYNSSQVMQPKATTLAKNNISSAELELLLFSGGDERLLIDPSTGANMYGCTPGPRKPSTSIHLSSSTATPVSPGAFAHLAETMSSLNKIEDINAIDDVMDELRQKLLDYFDILSKDADIIFVPSGTDATLQSVFLLRICLPRPTTTLANLVLAFDEAAGRVTNAASGRHFNIKNIRGETVIKGSSIAGLREPDNDKSIQCIELSFEKCQDETFVEESVDRLVKHNGDTHVLLHALDCSKLGNRTPTHECLNRIEQKYSTDILTVLIDACQLRMSPKRIRDHIHRGRLVTITGSKFLTGPPFSGAIIVPARFRTQIQQASVENYMSSELAAYSAISDWPRSWTNIRHSLSVHSAIPWNWNIGQYLRWTAAIFELHRYLAVPSRWREQFIQAAGTEIRAAFASVPHLIEPVENSTRSSFFDEDDEEFRHPTIFPFIIRQTNKSQGFLDNETCKDLYGKLQIPTEAYPMECLIGQPALVMLSKYQESITTFRISIDMRAVANAYEQQHGRESVTTNIFRSQVDFILKKIAHIINNQS